MSEWNYNLAEAPEDEWVLITRVTYRNFAAGTTTAVETMIAHVIKDWWCGENGYGVHVVAWMPLPDPAPLPEGD